ncbi:ATP-binding protein [Methanopyrus sp.]
MEVTKLEGLTISWDARPLAPDSIYGEDYMRIYRNVAGLLKIVQKAFDEPKGDLAIGFSGGKDSFTCALALEPFLREWDVNPKLVTVDVRVRGVDVWRPYRKEINRMAKALGYEFELVHAEEDVAELSEELNKPPCKICSAIRRRILAERHDVVVYGHTAEDAIETLMMSVNRRQDAGTFPPADLLEEDDALLLRPLYVVSELRTVRVYHEVTSRLSLPKVEPECPYAKRYRNSDSPRRTASELVERLREMARVRDELAVENLARGLARMALADVLCGRERLKIPTS